MEQSFNKVIDLLYLAKQDGVEVVLNEKRLQLKVAENRNIDESLLTEIRNNKQLIIDYLASDKWKVKVLNKNNRITRFDRNATQHIPLSFSQERLWFMDQLEGSVQYHSPVILRLLGNLNNEALLHSIRTLIERHESLRTVFYESAGQVYQSVKESKDWVLEIVEGSKYKEDEDALKAYIEKLFRQPFDLSTDYPIRGTLIRVGKEEHILVVTMHHIASDAWSISIIVKEVVELYQSYAEGRNANLPLLPLQYIDFAVWQREFLQGPVLDRKLNYWKQKLEGHTPLQLTTDHTRPLVKSTKGAALNFSINRSLSVKLQELSREQGTSMFMTLLAVFKVLLYRYSGQEDISVGTSIASRQQKELEGLVGFFVNTLVLRDEVSGLASFETLLQQVKATTLEAYEHQDLPFEKVVEAVVQERDSSRSPLFQVMLVLQNTPEASRLQLGDLELSGMPVTTNISKFDFTFFINETSGGLAITVEYSTDLYDSVTIGRMSAHFESLLESVVRDPKQRIGMLGMLSGEEESQLVGQFGTSKVWYPKDADIVSLFEGRVIERPEATALVCEGERLSYRELNERSNQLAHYLQSVGVSAASLVPLYVERSLLMVVGMLGILKAGAAYVPIDTDFPSDRTGYMLEDLGSGVIVSSIAAGAGLEEQAGRVIVEIEQTTDQPKDNLVNKPGAHDLAYVIYTSGSTGKPKGVMIEHGSLVDYYYGLDNRTGIGQCGSFALVSTIATDLGNTVIYASLLSGGALHVFSRESVSNAGYLHRYFRQHGIACVKIVPSHWKALSAGGELLLPGELLVFGGESLQTEIVSQIRLSGSSCRVVNHYGPTETTIGKLLHEVGEPNNYGHTVPVGKPFSNTQVYVLSRELQLCPVGVPGQLYIGGAGLSRGYVGKADLTRERFIDHPFKGLGGGRLYGTGDVVKWLGDGNLVFMGRLDDQVKIRGYRVELSEIEAVLRDSGLVSQAVVLAKEDTRDTNNKRLVGYVVGRKAFDREGIMGYLKEKLPEYMLPSVLVGMEQLPLTANGKIDRKLLADMDREGLEGTTGKYVAPRTETESRLAVLWQSVLELDQVGVEDDFFELGGHSLLAVRLISAIRRAFGVEMPIGELFDYPRISLLAERLVLPSQAALLPSVERSVRPDHVPLSFSQERLWFIDQLGGSLQYHIPSVLRLRGRVDLEALSGAMGEIIHRHEVLRTVIVEQEGTGYQVVRDKEGWQLEIIEGALLQEAAKLGDYIKQLIDRPFNLSSDYMVRASVIRLSAADHVLVTTLHHIASDGYSTSIMVRELAVLYNAAVEHRRVALAPLAVQYADYAIWQRRYLQGEAWEQKLTYWKDKLEGVAALQLPTDYPRPLVESTKGAVWGMKLDKELSDQLQLLSQQQGVTLFMTLLAAFNVLLYRYSGQEDICVGTPIAGRRQQELEGLIGFFVNTLALRCKVSGDTSFVGLLDQVRVTTLEAYEHQDVPFEKVVELVVKERDRSRSPLFQVMLALQNTPEIEELRLGDIELSSAGVDLSDHNTSKFDLTLFISQTSQGLHVSAEYNTDLFSDGTIKRMIANFSRLLHSIVATPQQHIAVLPLLSSEEIHQLLESFNDTQVSYPVHKNLVTLFEEQVIKTPESTALVFDDIQFSYRQLDEHSNRLARFLKSRDISTGSLVPICIERSIEMIIGVLGILKAGGTYVPVDAAYPEDRIRHMLEDTGASIVITNTAFASSFVHKENIELICVDNYQAEDSFIEKLTVDLMPDHTVCVIYTSGSSGKPKGVKLSNKGIVNRLYWMWETYPFEPGEKNAIKTSIGFGDHIWEIFGALNKGVTSVIFRKEQLFDLDHLVKKLADEKITRWVLVPSLLKTLLDKLRDEKISLPYLKYWTSSGEQLPNALVEDFYKIFPSSSHTLLNIYGSSEMTADASCYNTATDHYNDEPKQFQHSVPIGKPIANAKLYLTDKNEQLVPQGAFGEICVAGVLVGQGYLNLPEITSKRFAVDPFSKEPGSVMFKSGDYGRWLPDGNIEYAGRMDDQVKIRGNRVELGEIENVLQLSGIVKQCVVLAKEDKDGNNNLIGYIVAKESFDKHAISTSLRTRLPDFMVPAIWVELKSLPLTPNGKIDKKALADIDVNELFNNEYAAPRNIFEAKLVETWRRLLQVERLGIYDDFFESGGHSLLAMRLVSAIRKELGVEITIKDLFIHSDIATLAAHLQSRRPNSLPSVGTEPWPEKIPLSFSQNRLWLIDQLGGSLQYHIPAVLRLKGSLDTGALESSFQQIINRHQVLRTVILEEEGTGYQLIKEEDNWHLQIVDGSIFKDSVGALQRSIQQYINFPFNLEKDSMLRAVLIKLEEEDNVLVITLHHIASDGWSASIIVNELRELYNATTEKRAASLVALPVQYADYAIWQHKYLKGEAWDNKLSYWKNKLTGVPVLQLPIDYPRPLVQSNKGSIAGFTIDKKLLNELQLLSQQQDATLFMTLLAAFNVLLYRYSGQQDICVGTPIAGRQQQELEGLIGFFVNTLALRNQISGADSFNDVLKQVRNTTLEAFEHQEVPFEKVVELVVKERDMSRSPLFQVMLALQNTPEISDFDLKGIQLSRELTAVSANNTSKFDLTFIITEMQKGLYVTVEYCSDLFTETTINRMMVHFDGLLRSIIKDPAQGIGFLPMLTQPEQQQLLLDFNNTAVNYPSTKTIIDLFEEQVIMNPSGIALVFEGNQLTYQELNERSNQLAHYLKLKGVKEEMMVPVCIERSVDLIIVILAILKAGGSYVPVDPEYPVERITFILNDIGAELVLTSKLSSRKVFINNSIESIDINSDWSDINKEPADNLRIDVKAGDLAYVIYTSGSTGKPKGVMVTHNNVVSLVKGVDYVSLTGNDILLSTGSSSFDATTFEYWGMLLNGGKLILCSEDRLLDNKLLKEEILERGVTLMWFTSSWFNQLVEADITLFEKLSTILVGGEKLSEQHIEKLKQAYPYITIINGYGPTENTTFSITHKISETKITKPISIGRPLTNRTAFILDDHRQLVPVGVAGEIHVGGDGISRGYLNRPELTKSSFISNPFSEFTGSTIYKTGDMGRWLPDGNIQYLGRKDDQVKIRGYRVELGEIEYVLLQSGMVSAAVVILKEDREGRKRLVAYFVPAGDFEKEAIRLYLKTKLPEYMIPAFWVKLEKIPLTNNGKIDKASLPSFETGELFSNKYIAPQTALEKKLSVIWSELLGIQVVGIHDNFFELGGDSILTMKVVNQVRKLGYDIQAKDIFIHQTIARLSKEITQRSSDKASEESGGFTPVSAEKEVSSGSKIHEVKIASFPSASYKYLVSINATGNKTPLYIIAGGGGTANRFRKFAKMLDSNQPVYALQSPIDSNNLKDFPDTIEKIASVFIEEILVENPLGPYALSGHCTGGLIAFEMAKQLKARGKKIHMLAMFDTIVGKAEKPAPASLKNYYYIPNYLKRIISKTILKLDFEIFLLRRYTKTAIEYKIESLKNLKDKFKKNNNGDKLEFVGMEIFYETSDRYLAAHKKYHLTPYDGDVIAFYAKERYYFTDSANNIKYKKVYLNDKTKSSWEQYATSVTIYDVAGDHSEMFDADKSFNFAYLLQECLDNAGE